ncbi:DNA replication/repair protein RecF [Photobacterium sp. 2_MG-2023]|uniref:DNA replication/repair protein RecF n=1 Tax=Photobacterium sp. 2_MG-2023 TaxID=3062663 RepID=UPI0026E194BA|nr:DNA replication/repair protein RecF [Photobacterium sp. 2_MG-2023]MDO6582935.1 DNA replication/repair protein RecF [Photobacterium sp. 2_MG-2023]
MALTRFIVKDFRNLEACDLTFSEGFNFLVGANGSGKTSLLEAIYFLGHGRSFRSHLTSRIIRHGQDELVLHGRVHADSALKGDLERPLGIRKQRDGTTQVKIAGQTGQKVAQLAQILPLQLITPEGFELMVGGPKFRRAFIDWGVFHVEPRFYQAWSRVKRLTRQRNALLKTARSYRELSYWDQELAQLAEVIDGWRRDYIDALREQATAFCGDFLPEYDIQLGYYRGWEKTTPYSELLAANFERDMQLGYTVSGPNKADLRLKVSAMPVDDVLSRGQLKLLMCALRLAQGQQLRQATGKQCLYLIDDFASELDSSKRALLAKGLHDTQAQVVISAISEEQLVDMKAEKGKMFHVEQGKITAR